MNDAAAIVAALSGQPRVSGCALLRDGALLAAQVPDGLYDRLASVVADLDGLGARAADEWGTGAVGELLLRGDEDLALVARPAPGTFLVVLAPGDVTLAWLRSVTGPAVQILRSGLAEVPNSP